LYFVLIPLRRRVVACPAKTGVRAINRLGSLRRYETPGISEKY
jgi:hypothetical protein